jgi:hypothetical protein
MIITAAVLLVVAALFYTLVIRHSDLPEPEPLSPFKHLEDRKAAIYESLRDLQFEYRLGKLSDHDYQQTKRDLQSELAVVMAEMDRIKQELGLMPEPAGKASKAVRAAAPATLAAAVKGNGSRDGKGSVCPHCGAHFTESLKFCGECGKAMVVEAV